MCKGRPKLYRFEHNGVVVYDSKAKIAGQLGKLAPFFAQADESNEYIHEGKT